MIRVIRLSTFLDFGGIESKMVRLSQIDSKEIEFIYVSIGKGGEASEEIKKNGKKVICLDSKYKIPSLSTLFKLIQVFRELKPDVIHSSGAEANFHGILSGRLSGVRTIIVEEIGISFKSKISRVVFSLLYCFSNYVMAESKEVAQNIKRRLWIKRSKVKIVPNFIQNSEEDFSNSISNDGFNLLSISRLEKVKNIEGVLRVLAELKNDFSGLNYSIIGDGSCRLELLKLVEELNLEECVVFYGYQKEFKAILAESHLFILNSISEGFSNAILEAMNVGIPVISTSVGGSNEIIIDGVNGWLVEPGNDLALKNKLLNIFEMSHSDRNKIGREGKATVKMFTPKYHIEKLKHIYLKR